MTNRREHTGPELMARVWSFQAYPPAAKFPLGSLVTYDHAEYIVIGANDTGDGIEYALEDYGWLVWEEELQRRREVEV